MIYYVATERFSSTVRRFLASHRKELRGSLRSLTWEELFFEGAGPIGHYIFTDFDRLSRYELDRAAAFALALRNAAPEARILNHPLRALERFPLLVALNKVGINDFTATRIEAGQRPHRYPVFIRAEDGYGGPETDIINNDAEYDAALADLARRGLPLRGRVAIGYAGEKAANGYFQKYGAFNFDGDIIPYHRMNGRTWVVKSNVRDAEWIERRDGEYRLLEPAVDEELRFVRENPHRDILLAAFTTAGIDFGRADYGIVGGRVQIYEINTNPSLGGPMIPDARAERRLLVRNRLVAGFKSLDTPLGSRGRIRLAEAKPRAHNVHWPRWRLPASIVRRLAYSIGITGPVRERSP